MESSVYSETFFHFASMPSLKARRNLYRIIPFGLIWLVFSIVYLQLEKGILGDLNYYPATGNPYNFTQNLLITPFSALLVGTITGILEIYYFNKLFIQKSFVQKILYKSLIYLAIIIAFLIATSFIANAIDQHATVFSKTVWDKVWLFFSDYVFLSVGVYIAAIIVICQFYNEVSENMGQGVLTNFFTGKYHRPAQEERIFMFLDMKSSTTIAEQLGHVKYFEMLWNYYADLSDPVINYSGEIYQYVGDEIIVSWTLKRGIENNNCIRCFYAIKAAIKKQAAAYQKRFDVFPEFKAAFHCGNVTTGEIGVIKKEIIFTGDVLNATARIQGLCNEYQVDILLSGELKKKLDLEADFSCNALGARELKGRGERIELFTILPS